MYLITFIIFGVYFLMNLFVSVFIDHVQEMRKQMGGKSLFLSEVQEKFLNAEEMLLNLDFAGDSDGMGLDLGLRQMAKQILGKEDSPFNGKLAKDDEILEIVTRINGAYPGTVHRALSASHRDRLSLTPPDSKILHR